jgi:GNAT superfamily N-acetyltransferase
MSALIRPATPADVPAILGLIRELADYEKLLEHAKATPADLDVALFGDRPAAEALVAVVDGQTVGFALYFTTFSTFVGRPGIYLEDIYVQPAFRGQGLGKQFFRCIAQLAVERGCGRIEWSVLNWNTPAWKFYESLGATPLDDWTIHRLAGDAIRTLAESARP